MAELGRKELSRTGMLGQGATSALGQEPVWTLRELLRVKKGPGKPV